MIKRIGLDLEEGELVCVGGNEDLVYLFANRKLEELSEQEHRACVVEENSKRWETVKSLRNLEMSTLADVNSFDFVKLDKIEDSLETHSTSLGERGKGQGEEDPYERIVAHNGIYTIDHSDTGKTSSAFKGHGGAPFIIYKEEGQEIHSSNVWFNEDSPGSESLNAIKVENVYSPYNRLYYPFVKENEEILIFPRSLAYRIDTAGQPITYSQLGKELRKIQNTDYVENKIEALMLGNLVEMCEHKEPEDWAIVSSHSDEDARILEAVYYNKEYKELEEAILASSFQWSITPFKKQLDLLKNLYRESQALYRRNNVEELTEAFRKLMES